MTYIKYIREKYVENESFFYFGHSEPHIRHQELIFYFQQFKWNVKVTFKSEAIQQQLAKVTFYDTCIFVREPIKNKLKKRHEFQDFIQYINFHKLSLISDMITKINLLLKSSTSKIPIYYLNKFHLMKNIFTDVQNKFFIIANALKMIIQENSFRIKYSVYVKDLTWSKVLKENILIKENFNESALRVKRAENSHYYVYKKINQFFYEFNDTWIFLNEF